MFVNADVGGKDADGHVRCERGDTDLKGAETGGDGAFDPDIVGGVLHDVV